MTKKQGYSLVIISVALALLMNILFGRFLAVKISTIPLLNRWKLVSPQTPIVINTREEIRVSDSGDVQQGANAVSPKISLVILNNSSQVTVLGGCINLTSDGLFVTSKSVVDSQKAANLYIKLDDGSIGQVSSETLDSPTGLVILKTSLNNVSVANLGDSKNLTAGQRLIFLAPSIASFSPVFSAGFVSQSQNSDLGTKDSDAPSRSFKIQDSSGLQPGRVIANTNSEVVGLWDGANIISSDVIKNLSANFLSHQNMIVRPSFGFSYRIVSAAEAKLLSVAQGAKVISLDAGGAAQKSGLLENDIIQTWDGTDIKEDMSFEELLQRYKPGDAVSVKIARGKNTQNLKLIIGQVK